MKHRTNRLRISERISTGSGSLEVILIEADPEDEDILRLKERKKILKKAKKKNKKTNSLRY